MKDIKRKIKKRVKGITLIALIITIVIILILAGVTIAFTIGPNGIIEQAKNAKNKYMSAAESESTALNELANQIDSGEFGTISATDMAEATKIPDELASVQAVDKDNNALYYKDDTALNSKDLSNTTSDTTKVIISNGKVLDDYKVYYKAATADNISTGAVAYADGKIVIGNGSDTNAAYQQGYDTAEQPKTIDAVSYDIAAISYSYVASNSNKTISLSGTGYKYMTVSSINSYVSNSANKQYANVYGDSTNIYNYTSYSGTAVGLESNNTNVNTIDISKYSSIKIEANAFGANSANIAMTVTFSKTMPIINYKSVVSTCASYNGNLQTTVFDTNGAHYLYVATVKGIASNSPGQYAKIKANGTTIRSYIAGNDGTNGNAGIDINNVEIIDISQYNSITLENYAIGSYSSVYVCVGLL